MTVHLDSLFMFPPKWQFNVVIENAAPHAVSLAPDGAALFVDRGDGFERVEGALTASIGAVPAGQTVEGLMVFQAQRSADGRVLSLVYGTGRTRFGSSSRCRTSSPRFLLQLPQTRGRRSPLPQRPRRRATRRRPGSRARPPARCVRAGRARTALLELLDQRARLVVEPLEGWVLHLP